MKINGQKSKFIISPLFRLLFLLQQHQMNIEINAITTQQATTMPKIAALESSLSPVSGSKSREEIIRFLVGKTTKIMKGIFLEAYWV